MRALRRFSRPSLRGSKSGICDPVMITLLPRFSSIKLSADAVYDIVSVNRISKQNVNRLEAITISNLFDKMVKPQPAINLAWIFYANTSYLI